MTKKRFTTDNGSHEDVCLVDNLTKKEYESNFEDMVSLMNDIWNQTQRFEKHNQRLEKENEQLKKDFDSCSHNWALMYDEAKNKVEELSEEIEQLKSTINTITCDNTKMKKVLNTTKKENEYIKNTIKEAYETERTHIGKNTLKQLMEAIQ